MSIRRLPRAQGMWVTCDGTDTDNCNERRFTASVVVKVNRADAAKHGWGRGLRTDRKRRDQCPKHLAIERQLFREQLEKRAAEKQRRDELKKAKASAGPLPKRPRKRKASTAVSVGAVTEAEEATIGRPRRSPSADCAPAPA